MGTTFRTITRLALAGFALLAAGQARASVIFTTFGPGDAFNNLSAWIIGNPALEQQVAISFVAGFDGTLTSIRVATRQVEGTNDYNVFLASDNSGEPGAALETFSGLTFPDSAAIMTLTSVANPGLASGSTYWIVMNAADPANSNGSWHVNDQGFNGLYRNTGSGWFADSNASPAVEVNAEPDATAVPEPGTVGLALAGVLVLVLRRRA